MGKSGAHRYCSSLYVLVLKLLRSFASIRGDTSTTVSDRDCAFHGGKWRPCRQQKQEMLAWPIHGDYIWTGAFMRTAETRGGPGAVACSCRM